MLPSKLVFLTSRLKRGPIVYTLTGMKAVNLMLNSGELFADLKPGVFTTIGVTRAASAPKVVFFLLNFGYVFCLQAIRVLSAVVFNFLIFV
jgi:hypothetical protein